MVPDNFGRRAKVGDYYASPAETEKFSVSLFMAIGVGTLIMWFFQLSCQIFTADYETATTCVMRAFSPRQGLTSEQIYRY
jgi:hypothetical protein